LAGFTLVEVLVALVLLGMLTSLVANSVRLGTRAWSKAETVTTDQDDLEVVRSLMRRTITRAEPAFATTDLKDKTNIIDFVNFKTRIFPIGRLDKRSEGLIFLTNDGDIVNKILRAGNRHEKEYVVTVDKPITPDFVQKMRNGVRILGTVTQKCFVKQEGPNRFKIILTQGLNRQIRRMCEALGYNVETLKRTRIMNLTLSGLPPGKWRYFTPAEIGTITEMLKHSSKTAEGSEGMDE